MLTNPWPPRARAGSKPELDGGLGRVLAGVLQRFQAAEVDRSFQVGRVPAHVVGDVHGHRERAPAGRGPQRLAETTVGQERRIDAVGQFAQLLDRVLYVGGQLVEDLDRALRVLGHDVLGQPQVDGQRDQVLLGPIVQIPLHPAAFGVTAGHDAGAGGPQFLGLFAQLVQGGVQRGVQLDVVEGQAGLPGQLGEHPVVLLGEAVGVGGPFDHDQAEQFTAVADRRHPQLGSQPAVQQRGHPDRGPGVAGHAGPADDLAFPAGQHQGAGP
jgi:hypothetical protein